MTDPSLFDRPVRKAIIPAAGFGTRLFPATKAVKKELFPIVDRQGRAKPVIMAIVEEALSAGIESVGIVVQPDDRPTFEAVFQAPPTGLYFDKLATKYAAELQELQQLGDRVTILTQDKPEGFGYAVFCARDWIQNEPFLLLLGDHVYRSQTAQSCAQQLLEVFAQVTQSVIGIETAPIETISQRGCITGVWQQPRLLTVTQLTEKPTLDYAQQHLQVEGIAANQRLAVFGLYVLLPQIFDYLADHIDRNDREFGEFQLTSCLEQLRRDHGMMGYLVEGRSFDTGLPDTYRQALIEFRH